MENLVDSTTDLYAIPVIRTDIRATSTYMYHA
jgi:hypothetical protein